MFIILIASNITDITGVRWYSFQITAYSTEIRNVRSRLFE